MPYSDLEVQKEYQRNWIKNKAAKALEIMRQIKEANPCADCGGYFHYSAMDFDHIDGNKDRGVAKIAATGNIERMMNEIAKCDLVCSNCHRVRTWLRMNGLI